MNFIRNNSVVNITLSVYVDRERIQMQNLEELDIYIPLKKSKTVHLKLHIWSSTFDLYLKIFYIF